MNGGYEATLEPITRLRNTTVLLVSFLLLVVGYALVRMSFRFAKLAPPSYLEVAESFWEEPEPERDET